MIIASLKRMVIVGLVLASLLVINTGIALADEGTGNWEIDTWEDPMDDSKIVLIVLGDESGEENAGLGIRCQNNETHVITFWVDGIISDNNNRVKVRYRIDKEEPNDMRWEKVNSQAASLWSGSRSINFIKELFGHKRLILRASSYEGTNQAIFNIEGIENAIKPVREECNW